MTNKRLLREIEQWQKEGLISDESSSVLKSRYSVGSKNTLAIIFSVIGSSLIAAGIVLLFAKNWYSLPLAVKAVLSFLPLLSGQGLAMFTLIKKQDSLPWREGSAIFLTGALFASLQLVIQSFGLSVGSDLYLISCSILILPVIYILDAVSPLTVYFGALLSWGFQHDDDLYSVPVLTILLLAGIAYVFIHRKEKEPRRFFATWICAFAGVVYVLFLQDTIFESDINMAVMFTAFFLLLYAVSTAEYDFRLPFKPIGVVGSAVSVVVSIIISSEDYYYSAGFDNYFAAGFVFILLAAAVITAAIRKRHELLSLIYVICCAVCCVLCTLVPTFIDVSTLLLPAAFAALGAGVCLTVKGVREFEMAETNLGLLIISAVVAMSFFALETDLLVKGIAFLVLGAVFLGANVVMLKAKKERTR